jgi:hypothetical protein
MLQYGTFLADGLVIYFHVPNMYNSTEESNLDMFINVK